MSSTYGTQQQSFCCCAVSYLAEFRNTDEHCEPGVLQLIFRGIYLTLKTKQITTHARTHN